MINDDDADDLIAKIYEAINESMAEMSQGEGEALIMFVASNLLASLVGGRIEQGDLDEARRVEECCFASLRLALSRVRN